MNDKNVDIIKNFFDDFSNSIEKVLTAKFDEDVCPEIKFSIDCVESIQERSKYADKHSLCAFAFESVDSKGQALILIPEELVAASSDIIMGGEGKDSYKGNLSELEVNAALDLLNSAFDKVKSTFQALHDSSIDFPGEKQIITLDSDEHASILNNPEFDFVINYNLTLKEDLSFGIPVLFNYAKLKALLMVIGLIENEISAELPSIMPQQMDKYSSNMKNLSNIKIKLDAELGRSMIPIKDVLGFAKGSIVELDALVSEDLKIYANGLEVARARPVVVDEHLGIQITKIVDPNDRLKGN